MCKFEDVTSSRKAASKSSVKVDVSYKRLRPYSVLMGCTVTLLM